MTDGVGRDLVKDRTGTFLTQIYKAMRITRLTLFAAAWLLAVVVHAQTNYTYSSGTLNTAITDGSPVGISTTTRPPDSPVTFPVLRLT
jgi:hypothetical protein